MITTSIAESSGHLHMIDKLKQLATRYGWTVIRDLDSGPNDTIVRFYDPATRGRSERVSVQDLRYLEMSRWALVRVIKEFELSLRRDVRTYERSKQRAKNKLVAHLRGYRRATQQEKTYESNNCQRIPKSNLNHRRHRPVGSVRIR